MKHVNELAYAFADQKTKDKVDLALCKEYCKSIGYESDYDNIIVPIYKKHGIKLLYQAIKWNGLTSIESIDLDLLSVMVYFDTEKQKFVAYN